MVEEISPAHREELAASEIGEDHIQARQYRTLYGSDQDKAELRDLRIPRFMWREPSAFPGLLIPEYRVTGELIGYQWKPAKPQLGPENKLVKYASQSSTPNHLDVPPLMADQVRDPTNPLWITEGIKKADSLASHGCPVVTLTGVFNWRTKMGTLGDWEDIPLQGRQVVVCFDADAKVKKNVMEAMRRLGGWLKSKGAIVLYLIIPDQVEQPNGLPPVQVKGVDDFFHAGGVLSDLRTFATRELPAKGRDVAFTDAVMADTVCSDELEDRFRWATGLGWMAWTGKYWKEATDVTVTEAVRLWVISQYQAALEAQQEDPNRDMSHVIDGWRATMSAGKIGALVKLSKGILEAWASDFDSDPDLLNCPNGIVDLRTGQITPHDPDRLLTRITDVDYVPGAKNKDWDQALTAVPADVLEWFQFRMGQSITGYTVPDDLCVICQGGGMNGKSTVFDGITAALGNGYHIAVADRAMLGNATDNHPTEMMDFLGCRLAVLEETPDERHLDTTRLKKLVGTREITARRIRQDPVTFEATHSLFVNSNYRLTVTETDHGTWRRLALMVFPFTYRRPGEVAVMGPLDRLADESLRQRLKNAQAGEAILAWLVEGAQKWYAADRIMPELPERVRKDTLAWRKESDTVLAFISDHLEFDRDSHVLASDMTDTFGQYLADRNLKPWSSKTFVTRFGGHDVCSQNGLDYRKIKARAGRSKPDKNAKTAGSSYWAWLGVRFAEDGPETDDQDHTTPPDPEVDPFGEPQVNGDVHDQVPPVPSLPVNEKIPTYRGYRNVTELAEPEPRLRFETGEPETPPQPDSPEISMPLVFDLEGGDASEAFTYRDGAAYIRLAGVLGPDGIPRTDVKPADLARALGRPGVKGGHNILGFDGPVIAYHLVPAEERGAWWDQFCDGAIDTEITARLDDPPRSRAKGSEDSYDLDHVAQKLGVPGKTDDLKGLKKKFGGYDQIPLDDPDYHAYLVGDLQSSKAVLDVLYDASQTDYARREHRLANLAGHMTLNGFKVDVDLLHTRISEGKEKKAAAMEELHDVYGLPLGREVMRGRGKAKTPVFEPFASPLATTEGIEWLTNLWGTYGVVNPPLTEKEKLSTAAEPLRAIRNHPKCPAELAHALELMEVITTARTVYQTTLTYLAPDGRVHPKVSMRQASGRWSVTEPGLTVFGKRGGKHIERDVFIADEGCVIMTCDLSQVDMRAVAGHCQDPAYMSMFEPGKDIHQEIADTLGISRHDAKAFGHGYNYGLSLKSAIRDGADPKLARIFYQGMAERFPIKNAWTEKIREQAADGGILDNGFGRKMRCLEGHHYTVAPALMGQGGARDITCEVLLRLIDRHPEYKAYLRGYVHDEFIFCVPEDQAEEVGAEIVDAFTWEWRGVPILCDLSPTGLSWGSVSAK